MALRTARTATVQSKQNKIYDILYAANRNELNYVLTCSDVNLALLFLNVKDYEVFEFPIRRSKSGYFKELPSVSLEAMASGDSPRRRSQSFIQAGTAMLDGYLSSSEESTSDNDD